MLNALERPKSNGNGKPNGKASGKGVRVVGETVVRSIVDLCPNPWNPNRMTDFEKKSLGHGLLEDGWLSSNALTVWGTDERGRHQGVIIDGEQRWTVGRELGFSEAPVAVLDGLTENQARKLTIKLDKKRGAFDPQSLAELVRKIVEVDGIETVGLDLGFTALEIDMIMRPINQPNYGDDRLIEKPKNPKTKVGDLYQLGRHRLLCGDATDAKCVARLLDGATPNIMSTDPPYGVDYDPNWRHEAAKAGKLAGTPRRVGKVSNDDRRDWTQAWKLFPGNVAYVWHADIYSPDTGQQLRNCGFDLRALIIWSKPNFPIGRGHYHHRHEPCWYAVRSGQTGGWIGDRKQCTVWDVALDSNDEGGHSTQKPRECMAKPIRNHEGDVYDPFVGSGTTLIAAEQLGRSCYAMDCDPAYCDVVVRRWEAVSGEKAKLLGRAA